MPSILPPDFIWIWFPEASFKYISPSSEAYADTGYVASDSRLGCWYSDTRCTFVRPYRVLPLRRLMSA